MEEEFKEGDRVSILGGHSWAQESGTLYKFQNYGPCGMFKGWQVHLDNGCSAYAQVHQIARMP